MPTNCGTPDMRCPARGGCSFGFHSAQAALALVMLTCGPIDHVLPHERMNVRPHRGQ